MKICLIRPPALPRYHDIDIKEDPMLTAVLGYFESINLSDSNWDLFDFQLDKNITYKDLLKNEYAHYVVAARDVGESYRYSVRIANLLSDDTTAGVWLYGQVAPLRNRNDLKPRVIIVNQSETELAAHLGIETTGAHFAQDLRYKTYYPYINMEDWQQSRRKGVLETTRGCPYKCKFCFINVGQSYEKRWQTRNNDMIMADIKSYTDMGINQLTFLDSEFLGRNKNHYKSRTILLQRIIDELPPIKYMILCRADTLLEFDQFNLFKQSGLNKVLVGVESLYQPDLDFLRKDTTVEKLKQSIIKLIEIEVECCLTFLTFHRNTTIEGLRSNLSVVKDLYSHPKARYLGMPNFSFNMEVVRGEVVDEVPMEDLTNVTYLRPLLEARGQVESGKACFPVNMEPLIEVFRILQYEWVVKKCELIREKAILPQIDKDKINMWFNNLGMFCVDTMMHFVDIFEAGGLTFKTLKIQCEHLFDMYKEYHGILPVNLQFLATYDHFAGLDYKKSVNMDDHGWDQIIPEKSESNFCEVEYCG